MTLPDRQEEGAPAVLSEAEAALWTALRRQGSAEAREALFDQYAPFARSLAGRRYREHRGADLDLEDLRQLAYAGLLEAIAGFDPNRGAPFRAYAARRIHGSILDGIGQASEMREQIAFRHRLRRERTRSLGPIEDPARMTPAQALEALAELAIGLAVGFMLEDSGLYHDEERAPPAPTAYDSLAWKEAVTRLGQEVEGLGKRERAILRHHYFDGLTFDQIGGLLGLTKGRISQLHREAMQRLRKRLGPPARFSLER